MSSDDVEGDLTGAAGAAPDAGETSISESGAVSGVAPPSSVDNLTPPPATEPVASEASSRATPTVTYATDPPAAGGAPPLEPSAGGAGGNSSPTEPVPSSAGSGNESDAGVAAAPYAGEVVSLVEPEGCTEESYDTGTECSVTYADCGELYAACQQVGSAFDCTCRSPVFSLDQLSFDGETDSITSCRRAAAVCNQPPSFGDVIRCEDVSASFDDANCERTAMCSRDVFLSDGTRVSSGVLSRANCTLVDARWSCACNYPIDGNYSAYTFDSEIEGEAACILAESLCQQGRGRQFDTPSACADYVIETLDTECTAQRECTQQIDVEGELHEIVNREQAYCSQVGDAGFCTCEGDRMPTLQLEPTLPIAADTCQDAAQACAAAQSALPSGPVSCELTSASIDGPYSCSASALCTQPLPGLDVEIVATASLWTTCSDAGSGWACACNDQDQMIVLPVEPGAELLASCEATIEQCAAVVDLQFGSGLGSGL